MGQHDLPPRTVGATEYTVEERGHLWRVVDPEGIVMNQLYPSERMARRHAENCSRLAKVVDAQWVERTARGVLPLQYNRKAETR